jgi:hypothetical protein
VRPEQESALTGGDDRAHSVLHGFSPFTWVGVALMSGMKCRMVPAEFWAQDVNEDGTVVAVVACPCREEPRVPELALVQCACQRCYFHGVKEVWSLNVPSSQTDESPPEGVHYEEDVQDEATEG